MSFYDEWVCYKNTNNEKRYIDSFLMSTVDSVDVLRNGKNIEIEVALSVVNSVSIATYVSMIDKLSLDKEVKTSQVPQFSELKDGIYRIPELLEFANNGLQYEEIGYQLVKSKTASAGIKYGENHSKLAETVDLVEIKNRPSNVTSTALGKYLIKFLPEEKNEFIKRLFLRNYMLQKMIAGSANDILKYRDIVHSLSLATAIRRRNNVRILLEFILKNTPEEKRLNNIDWQVAL